MKSASSKTNVLAGTEREQKELMPLLIDRSGERYGQLTVISRTSNDKHKNVRWLCQCDCGNKKVIRSGCLVSGKVQGCGCVRLKKITKHGLRKSGTYRSWAMMKDRCTNSNSENYKYYGGRGIRFCKRWKKFPAFVRDMGIRPDGKTLDRKMSDGNYTPSNCRWATYKQQVHNRRGYGLAHNPRSN